MLGTYVETDFDVSLEEKLERMKADGILHRVSEDINSENFPPPKHKRGKVNTPNKLIFFNWVLNSLEIYKELAKMNLEPADIREVLDLVEERTNIIRYRPLITLVDHSGRIFPVCISEANNFRQLGIMPSNTKITPNYLIVGVHKCRVVRIV